MEHTENVQNSTLFKFKAHQQPNDPMLDEKRKKCALSLDPENMRFIFPDNTLVKKYSSNERPGVCYHIAMKMTLGLSEQQFRKLEKSMRGCEDWVDIMGMPYKFFDQKENPAPGNLVTYAPHNDEGDICHFGIVTPEKKIRSKIGTSPFIYDHDVWHAPDHFGNRVCYWELKETHKTDAGRQLLFNELKSACNSYKMKDLVKEHEQLFFLIAQGYITKKDTTNVALARTALKKVMCLDINARNCSNETVLMIAARKGEYDLVELYVQHGADIDLKNNQGLTALDIAKKLGHDDIVKYLST